jgi:restriction system protein
VIRLLPAIGDSLDIERRRRVASEDRSATLARWETSCRTYRDLILPTIRAVHELGGSAKANEIKTQIIDDLAISDEMLGVMYENRPETSVAIDRVDWARSYSKLGGALDSPRRGLFLLPAWA